EVPAGLCSRSSERSSTVTLHSDCHRCERRGDARGMVRQLLEGLATESPSQDGQDDCQCHQRSCKANQPSRETLNPCGTLPQQEALSSQRYLPFRDDWRGCPGTIFLHVVLGSIEIWLKEFLHELDSLFLLVVGNGLTPDHVRAYKPSNT